jgi:hypothetical protein
MKLRFLALGCLLFSWANAAGGAGECNRLYADIITQPTGKVRQITSTVNGRPVRFNLFHEREIEARITFPLNSEIPQDVSAATIVPRSVNQWHGQSRVEEVIDGLIYSTRDDELSFRPLRSSTNSFHSKKAVVEKELRFSNAKPGELNREIELRLPQVHLEFNGPNRIPGVSRDELVVRYLIGSQSEISTYYDDAGKSLEKLGYTARVKSWYPLGKAGEGPPIKRVLTVKKGIGSQKVFHDRSEFSVVLPDELTDQAEIAALIGRVLASVDSASVPSGKITPLIQITNQRNGIDLTHQGKKIGFVVVDSFQAQKVSRRGTPTGKVSKEQSQLEIEVLSDAYSRKLYREQPQLFQALLTKLTAQMPDSQLTTTPKKTQGMRALANSVPEARKAEFEAEVITFPMNEFQRQKENLRPYAIWTQAGQQKALPLELDEGSLLVRGDSLIYKSESRGELEVGRKIERRSVDVYDPNHEFKLAESHWMFAPAPGMEAEFNGIVRSRK